MLLSPAAFSARPWSRVVQDRARLPAAGSHSGRNKVSATTPLLRPSAARRDARRATRSVVAVAAPASGAARGRRSRSTAAPTPASSSAPRQAGQGSLFGAIALITGSTVGAGMLALPEVTAPAGIVPTAVSLGATWVLLTLDALLIAEVNLAARAARDATRAAQGGDGSGGCEPGAAATAGGGGSIVTLRQMAEFSLGKAGKSFTLLYLLLAYSLLTAYCSKAADVLGFFAGGGLPPLAAAAAFAGGVGGLLYAGGPRATDALCQGLTSALLALFAVILAAGGAAAGGGGVAAAAAAADWSALQPALPIIFLALVYHDLVPVIVDYLGGDRSAIRSAIVLGSLVPLAMFVSWEAVALALLPSGLADSAASGAGAAPQLLQASLASGGGAAAASGAPPGALGLALDPVEVFVRRSSPLIGSAVEGFSLLAVLTSFIGTTLSLSETLRTEVPPLLRGASRQLRRLGTAADSLAGSRSDEDDELACLAQGGGGAAAPEPPAGEQRGLALALTLCPPLALAAANPDSFLGALQLAGGYFMTLLYGVLPPLMAWQLRRKLLPTPNGSATRPPAASAAASDAPQKLSWRGQAAGAQHEEMVPGGPPVLGGLFAAAVLVVGSQLAADAGLAAAGGGGEAGFVQGLIEAALLGEPTSGALAAAAGHLSAALSGLQA